MEPVLTAVHKTKPSWPTCRCGCGEPVPVARRTRPERGIVKGEPLKYVAGHQQAAHPPRLERYTIDSETGCWNWSGPQSTRGWGQVRWFDAGVRTATRAHRYFWEHHRGPIPDGQDVHHECGNRLCVNPDHLALMDHAEHARLHRQAA